MKQNRNSQAGFGLIGIALVILVLVAVAGAGIYVYHRDHAKSKANSSSDTSSSTNSSTQSGSTGTTTPDPYAGWKTATSPRAGFSIKYPASWTYSEAVGNKDNVEHILIDSANFHFEIDSYSGTDPLTGAAQG